MSVPEIIVDEPDFENQMRSLVAQAEQQEDDRNIKRLAPNLLQMLKPLVLGLEALTRATMESRQALVKVEEASEHQKQLPGLMTGVQETLDRRDSINQQLFDALHEELRGYKDTFLLEILHKPVVRDLIALHDYLLEVHRQFDLILADQKERLQEQTPSEARLMERINNLGQNLDHVNHFLIEVMARMEVTPMEPCLGKLDKKKQRAVSIEPADTENEDGEIAHCLKPGFYWRDRIVRPEEVVIKKWKEGCLEAIGPDSEK